MAKKSTENRGGARPNAGRKPIDERERKHPVTLFIEAKYISGEQAISDKEMLSRLENSLNITRARLIAKGTILQCPEKTL